MNNKDFIELLSSFEIVIEEIEMLKKSLNNFKSVPEKFRECILDVHENLKIETITICANESIDKLRELQNVYKEIKNEYKDISRDVFASYNDEIQRNKDIIEEMIKLIKNDVLDNRYEKICFTLNNVLSVVNQINSKFKKETLNNQINNDLILNIHEIMIINFYRYKENIYTKDYFMKKFNNYKQCDLSKEELVREILIYLENEDDLN